jgi:hypothetical protein
VSQNENEKEKGESDEGARKIEHDTSTVLRLPGLEESMRASLERARVSSMNGGRKHRERKSWKI